MLFRAVILVVVLSIPLQVRAADYVVHAGDTLSAIATRYGVSVPELARINEIGNVGFVRAGRVLVLPVAQSMYSYRVRWGDSLLGIASRYHMSVQDIRSLNPTLSKYLIAGEWLKLCGVCFPTSRPAAQSAVPTGVPTLTNIRTAYYVRAGDTLSGIAAHYGVSITALLDTNRLADANRLTVGERLSIPQSLPVTQSTSPAKSLITTYAARYGMPASLPLAVAWQESGFNQNVTSRTGAVGIMQVEPYTAQHISRLWGRPVNLYNVDDNVHAGVYWLAHLLAYYGGNQHLAIAAYYQGTNALAQRGLYRDTTHYVNNVMALKGSFGN